MAFVQYGYQDQNRNWSDSSPAAVAKNDDKEIQTHFVTLGLQYMFSQSWGILAEWQCRGAKLESTRRPSG